MALWKSRPGIMKIQPQPALFLDRDGVLIKDCHYLDDPNLVELIPGVPDALFKARKAGYLLIGVSNQSGLGRGVFGPAQFAAVMERLDEMLAQEGIELDAFFYCPHAPDDHCECRKPLPGMLHDASEIMNWNSEDSWVIGDKKSDVALGRNANMGGALVLTGYGEEQKTKVEQTWPKDPKVKIFSNLPVAVEFILATANNGDQT